MEICSFSQKLVSLVKMLSFSLKLRVFGGNSFLFPENWVFLVEIRSFSQKLVSLVKMLSFSLKLSVFGGNSFLFSKIEAQFQNENLTLNFWSKLRARSWGSGFSVDGESQNIRVRVRRWGSGPEVEDQIKLRVRVRVSYWNWAWVFLVEIRFSKFLILIS